MGIALAGKAQEVDLESMYFLALHGDICGTISVYHCPGLLCRMSLVAQVPDVDGNRLVSRFI